MKERDRREKAENLAAALQRGRDDRHSELQPVALDVIRDAFAEQRRVEALEREREAALDVLHVSSPAPTRSGPSVNADERCSAG
jgi:hypothetical protein